MGTSKPPSVLYEHKQTLAAKRKRGAKVGSANMALNGIKKLEKLGVLK